MLNIDFTADSEHELSRPLQTAIQLIASQSLSDKDLVALSVQELSELKSAIEYLIARYQVNQTSVG